MHAILTNPRRTIRSIQTVAAEHGFNDLADFNRRFRDRYGSGPVELRKLARKGLVRFKRCVSRASTAGPASVDQSVWR